MTSRILCPTDFSPASINATEYAARLAKIFHAQVTLMHVQRIYLNEGVDMFSGQELQSVREAREAGETMEKTCHEIEKSFGVSCDHSVISSLGSFEKKLAGESGNFDLTVIGTNGADTAYQFYFGSHSYRLARQAKGPVLIVPEDCPYSVPGLVVLASDYKKGQPFQVAQLRSFAEALKSVIQPVHLSQSDQDPAREDFEAFRVEIGKAVNELAARACDSIVSTDAADALFDYIGRSGADLVALNLPSRGILYESTHANLVKKVTSGSVCPVFIFHR